MPEVQASATGAARRLRQPEREEAAAALVDVRASRGCAARGRARARAASSASPATCTRAHPAARELVGEGAQAEIGVGGWHRLQAVDARRPPPAPRLHADGRELGRGDPGAGGTLPRARARPGGRGRGRPSSTASRRSRSPAASCSPATRWAGAWRCARARRPERVRRLVLVSRVARARGRGGARRAARRRRGARGPDRGDRGRGVRARVGGAAAVRRPAGRGRRAAREDRLRRSAAEHAAQLRGLGTGVMPPLWDRLGELAMPVTLVVGERDAKFRAIAERMHARLPDAVARRRPGRRPRGRARGPRRRGDRAAHAPGGALNADSRAAAE